MLQSLTVNDTDGRTRKIKMMTHNGAQRTGPVHVVYAGGMLADSFCTGVESRAEALCQWTFENHMPFTRFNYIGHGKGEGRSDGECRDITLTRMFSDLHAVIQCASADGRPVYLIASSA